MGQNGLANSVADHVMNGVTLVVLVICGQQLLRIVAPNATSMRTYWLLMLAMLVLAFAEARLADFAYGRLVVPLLPGVSNDNAHMFAYPNAVVPFIVAGAFYYVMNLLIEAILNRVEKSMSYYS